MLYHFYTQTTPYCLQLTYLVSLWIHFFSILAPLRLFYVNFAIVQLSVNSSLMISGLFSGSRNTGGNGPKSLPNFEVPYSALFSRYYFFEDCHD